MHILMFVVIGLLGLALFYFGASFFGKSGAEGSYAFLWAWLAVSICNGIIGVVRVGIPVINEIGAFIPIYGIPAAVAWYLAYKYGAAR